MVLLAVPGSNVLAQSKAKKPKMDFKPLTVSQVPSKIDSKCRDGKAKVYDECSDQQEILKTAIAKAKKEKKTLLVVLGAEWCIWCHVFQKHVAGEYAKYEYDFQHTTGPVQWEMREKLEKSTTADAKALNHYVAKNFVVVYIEAQYSPNGALAVQSTGVDTSKLNYFPVIFSLNKRGKVAQVMDPYTDVPGLEIRKSGGEDYRGFKRRILLAKLKELKAAATKSPRE